MTRHDELGSDATIWVVGSINLDLVVDAPRHPRPGETIEGTSLRRFPGGKGANQAVAAARAGARTRLVGRVGADDAGRELVGFLAGAGVDCTAVGIDPSEPTGTALITVAGADNAIVVIGGANAALHPDDLGGLQPAAGDVVVSQFETPVVTIASAFRTARSSGARTILNPAPSAAVSPELLSLTDVLVVNEHEHADLVGSGVAVTCDLVVTSGAGGATVQAPDGPLVPIAGHVVEAIDSTGAGDCFVGYLAAGLAAGSTLEAAATRANIAAALSVTRAGAATSIPTADEVDDIERNGQR